MKVKTVSYQKVFPLGMYINERIGVEIDVEDAPESAFKLAKELVEKWHKESNPQLYEPILTQDVSSNVPIVEIKKDPKQEASQRMIEAINSCTELKVLESFKLLVKNNPDFQKAYDEKLKSFNI